MSSDDEDDIISIPPPPGKGVIIAFVRPFASHIYSYVLEFCGSPLEGSNDFLHYRSRQSDSSFNRAAMSPPIGIEHSR